MFVSSARSDHNPRLAVALRRWQRRVGSCPAVVSRIRFSGGHVTAEESSLLHGRTFALVPLSSFSAAGDFGNGVGDGSRHWRSERSCSLRELVTDWRLTSGGFWNEGDVVRVILKRIVKRYLRRCTTLRTLPAPVFRRSSAEWNTRAFSKSFWTLLCFLKIKYLFPLYKLIYQTLSFSFWVGERDSEEE